MLYSNQINVGRNKLHQHQNVTRLRNLNYNMKHPHLHVCLYVYSIKRLLSTHMNLKHMHSYLHTFTNCHFGSKMSQVTTGSAFDKGLYAFWYKGAIWTSISEATVKDESVLIYLRRCGERSGAKMIWMINDPLNAPAPLRLLLPPFTREHAVRYSPYSGCLLKTGPRVTRSDNRLNSEELVTNIDVNDACVPVGPWPELLWPSKFSSLIVHFTFMVSVLSFPYSTFSLFICKSIL